MVTKVITVRITDSLSLVDQTFRMHKIRHLPVINQENQLVGIVTLSDLLPYILPRITEEGYVSHHDVADEIGLEKIMTQNPITLNATDSLIKAVAIMAEQKFGCIPIVERSNHLVGIITQIDVLKFLHRTLALDS